MQSLTPEQKRRLTQAVKSRKDALLCQTRLSIIKELRYGDMPFLDARALVDDFLAEHGCRMVKPKYVCVDD